MKICVFVEEGDLNQRQFVLFFRNFKMALKSHIEIFIKFIIESNHFDDESV